MARLLPLGQAAAVVVVGVADVRVAQGQYLGGQTRELVEGDSYLALSNVPHGVTALEDSIAIDIFSPPRTEYLD